MCDDDMTGQIIIGKKQFKVRAKTQRLQKTLAFRNRQNLSGHKQEEKLIEGPANYKSNLESDTY